MLNNIELTVHGGEIFGIMGLSGAGKSTLIRCMNHLEKPTSGHVSFDGQRLDQLSAKQLHRVRQKIGMIFQTFNLFEQRTVLQNICYPLEISGSKKSAAQQKAQQLLHMVGLADKVKAYPSQLSGGQKQRVAIARALATDPKVLLCDEATSALDPNTTASILELLKSINQSLGVTIVIVTHEMAVIEKICDRVAVIDNGQIVELATIDEIFKNPRSTIAKNFILPKAVSLPPSVHHCYRIVFSGNASYEPIVAGLVLHCQCLVNIMYADTKDVDGKAYGEILLQLPDDADKIERILFYLKEKGIFYREEVAVSGTRND